MLTLADVFRRHGEAYLLRYGDAVLPSHVRAVRDVVRCRTGQLGGHLAECTSCGHKHLRYHSCRNRACPSCGRDATARWLAQQRELLLPVSYYHVVFTLPAELRRVVRSHQQLLLTVLFRAAFDALQAMCHDPRWLGGRIGARAVLHTWTRVLDYLGRYVHRTALTDHALLHCDEQSVRFAYTDCTTHERKAMTLPAQEFMRRFLQHVPLKGLHRVRAFGLLHPSHRTELRRLQLLLGDRVRMTAAESERVRAAAQCPACKAGELRLYRRLTAEECAALAAEAATVPATATARAPPRNEERCRCA